MRIEIKSRWSAKILFEGEFGSIKLAVRAALDARADLTGADLTGADLTDADLTGADLTDAKLTRADLTGADLNSIRDDIWAVLSASPREVAALRAAIAEGRIDGSCYDGKCACLVGTIANAAGVQYQKLPFLMPNGSRPAERFFMAINPGDTPDKCQAAKLAIEWIDQWITNVGAAFSKCG